MRPVHPTPPSPLASSPLASVRTRRRWRQVTTLDEWRGTPSLSHVFRSRFLRDPAWACLPQPPLEARDEAIHLTQAEALAAQVAALVIGARLSDD